MSLDKEIKQLNVGELLKKSRKEQGFTIAEVVRATKIRYSHVEAIENNNYVKLPERTYTLGYIANYSKFLKLDSKKILKQAELEYKLKDPIYDNMVQNNRLDKKYNPINVIKENVIDFIFILFSVGFKRYSNENDQFKHKGFKKGKISLLLIIVIVLVIIILIGFFALKKTTKIIIDESPVTINNKVANELNIQKFQKDIDKTDNKNDDSNKIIKQEDMVVVNKSPSNDEAEKEVIKSTAPTKNLNNTVKQTSNTKLTPWPKSSKVSNITLFFNKDVWVKVYNKNNKEVVYLDAIFKKGERFKIPNIENLVMNIGDYKGMYLVVSNKVVYLSSNSSVDVLRNIDLESSSILSKYATSQ